MRIYVDGASRGNPGPAAIGVLIEDDAGQERARISKYIGTTTNNQAEYRALIAGLLEAAALGARSVEIRTDSELMVRQIQGSYMVRNTGLKPLHREVTQLLSRFSSFHIRHVPRKLNTRADGLANKALDEHAQDSNRPLS